MTKPILQLLAALVFCVVFASRPSFAENLGASERSAALLQIIDEIKQHYVVKDRVAAIVDVLTSQHAAGFYDVESPAEFARRISLDLERVSADGHLYLKQDPDRYAAMTEHDEADQALAALLEKQAVLSNSGIEQLEILPGNVRLMRLSQFRWSPRRTPRDHADAARFLVEGDALIVDLRDNGGGSSDAADSLLERLLPPDPLRPRSKQSRQRNRRLIGKPIFVLINAGTGSAAEAFAYQAQAERVATIVGMPSYGAANNTRFTPIPPSFVLSASSHIPINPITGTNWEGVGVKPDLSVSSDLALPAAHAKAIALLAAKPGLSAAQAAAYQWALAPPSAIVAKVSVPASKRRRYAGCFGVIALQLRDGKLYFSRHDRPKRPQQVELAPLDADGQFLVPGYKDLRVKVEATGITLMHGSADAVERFERGTCDSGDSGGVHSGHAL